MTGTLGAFGVLTVLLSEQMQKWTQFFRELDSTTLNEYSNPELRKIVKNISMWEWKMSAPGFFVVDLALTGGVFLAKHSNLAACHFVMVTPSLNCLDPFHHDDLRCHTVSATRRSNRPGELYIFVKVQNV